MKTNKMIHKQTKNYDEDRWIQTKKKNEKQKSCL